MMPTPTPAAKIAVSGGGVGDEQRVVDGDEVRRAQNAKTSDQQPPQHEDAAVAEEDQDRDRARARRARWGPGPPAPWPAAAGLGHLRALDFVSWSSMVSRPP